MQGSTLCGCMIAGCILFRGVSCSGGIIGPDPFCTDHAGIELRYVRRAFRDLEKFRGSTTYSLIPWAR
jgi:hypothetical protein